MRELFVFYAVVAGFSSPSALAQTVSGGQAPQAGGVDVRADPYNSTNAGAQYLQRKQSENLPTETTPAGKLGPARPAKADELAAGAIVNDKVGVIIAKIDQIDPDGVVVSTGATKIKIPADAFGHNKAGLLLDMTKTQFDELVRRTNPSP